MGGVSGNNSNNQLKSDSISKGFLLFNYEYHWLNYIQTFHVPKLITTEGKGMTILNTTTFASNIFWSLSGFIIIEMIPIIILIYITPILTAYISRGVNKGNLDINHIGYNDSGNNTSGHPGYALFFQYGLSVPHQPKRGLGNM